MPAFNDACHMCEALVCVFTADPGQSVEPTGACVYTSNRDPERKRRVKGNVCVKERQPEGSKCFDK